MIFKKGNMWKVAGSSAKYATEEEALKAAGIHQAVMKEAPVEKSSCRESSCREDYLEPFRKATKSLSSV